MRSNKQMIKGIVLSMTMILAQICASWCPLSVYADEIEYTDGIVDDGPAIYEGDDSEYDEDSFFDELCSDSIIEADITGTYYTLSADNILGQINKIRKEAYEEGLVDEYVPLKWSAVLENASRKRAMEAGITIAHENLYDGNIFDYSREGGFWGLAENLAWNNEHNAGGITYGINQFYEEKKDYLLALQGKSHGQTGHYTSMINPGYEYVGVGGCQMGCTPYGWFTVAMELGGSPHSGSVDETKDATTGKVTNRLKVSDDHISGISLTAPSLLDVGLSEECSLDGTIRYDGGYGAVTQKCTIADSEGGAVWISSDESVVTVDKKGVVTAVSAGSATVTVTIGKISKSCEIIVVSGDFKVEAVKLDKNSIELAEGDTYQLTATTIPEGVSATVTFASADPSIAEVNSNGLVTARKAGQTDITAACDDAQPAICSVTVSASDVVPGDTPYGNDPTDGVWIAKQSIGTPEYTGKAVVLSGLRVYHDRKLLEQGKDYTISYKNNVNAADTSDKTHPTAVVNVSGEYKTTRTIDFSIKAVDISDTGKVTQLGEQTAIGNGRSQKPVPELYYNSLKLANKKDFEVSYPDADYTTPGIHTIGVTGKGNYTGDRTCTFRITEDLYDLAKASVSVKPAYPGDKKIYFRGSISASDLAVIVKIKGNEIASDLFEITQLPTAPGKGSIRIEPTEAGKTAGYCGYKIVTITTVADRQMKDVVFDDFVSSMIFDPSDDMIQNAKLSYKGVDLVEGTDYTVIYSANRKVGKAKATYTGKGRYAGKQIKTYSITPYTNELTIKCPESVAYTKGGVTPPVVVTHPSGKKLDPKSDYTIKIINKSNSKPGTMQFTVEGKGNYKGYKSDTISVTVTNGNLLQATMKLTDKAYVSKGNGWKSAVKVIDSNGKGLSAGTDYNKNIVYYYEGISSNSVPASGTTIYVTVYGINNYAGSHLTGTYKIK